MLYKVVRPQGAVEYALDGFQGASNAILSLVPKVTAMNPLTWLEWLSRYGFIDIIFGIGILGYLRRKLRRTVVDYIDGVEILPHFNVVDGWFEIEVRNTSRDTLYIYRAYFRPGYLSSKTIWSQPKTLIFMLWANDRFPSIDSSERKNVQGEYVISAVDRAGNAISPTFLEIGASAYYRIKLQNNGEVNPVGNILEEHKAGRLTLHLVHGTRPNILGIQL